MDRIAGAFPRVTGRRVCINKPVASICSRRQVKRMREVLIEGLAVALFVVMGVVLLVLSGEERVPLTSPIRIWPPER